LLEKISHISFKMSEVEGGQPQQTGSVLCGTWNHVKSENFQEFLGANGANWMIQKMAALSSPTLTITQEGDKMTIKLASMMKTKESSFTIGEEFEEEQHNGMVMVCSSRWDGDKLIVDMRPKEENSTVQPQKHSRYVEGDELITVLEVGDVVAKRYFKKAPSP
jgi:hypothetical protein